MTDQPNLCKCGSPIDNCLHCYSCGKIVDRCDCLE